MRRFCIILLIGTSILVTAMGCDDDSVAPPDGSLEDLEYIGWDWSPCFAAYFIEFKDRSGGGWYWPALGRSDSLVYRGDGIYREASDNAQVCTLYYYYYGDLADGDYDLLLFRCASLAHVKVESKATDKVGPADDQVPVSTVMPMTCELKQCSGGWFYCEAMRSHPGTIAAGARITTRYGQLCGEPKGIDDSVAHAAAYVAIHAAGNDAQVIFAETGYRRFRDTSGAIDSGWYACIFDGSQTHMVRRSAWFPEDYSIHDYGLALDTSLGVWTFYYDNDSLQYSQSILPWWNKSGDGVNWAGEVRGHECDMPGRDNQKCRFSECWYDFGAGLEEANFYAEGALFRIDDSTEWRLERLSIDESTFDIWDLNPLPLYKAHYADTVPTNDERR